MNDSYKDKEAVKAKMIDAELAKIQAELDEAMDALRERSANTAVAPVRVTQGIIPSLFLLLVVLKLTGSGVVAEWSWWWVASPLWVYAAVALFVSGMVYAVTTTALLLSGASGRRSLRKSSEKKK
jgi:fatty acid desaturase